MIKITGGVDVNKLLDDVNKALTQGARPRGPGHPDAAHPAHGRAAQAGHRRRQGPEGRDLHRQGRQDPAPHGRVARHRRPEGSSSPNGSADFKLDFSISDLNEDQEISEPSDAEAVRPAHLAARRPRPRRPRRRRLVRLRLLRRRLLGLRLAANNKNSRSTRSASPTPAATPPRRANAPTCWPRSPPSD